MRSIWRNQTGIEDWILEKAYYRRKDTDQIFHHPYDMVRFFLSRFTVRNGILSPTVRKNCSSDEITRTIYLNSARSEQFLATEFFFNFRKIIIQIGKKYWDSETSRKC